MEVLDLSSGLQRRGFSVSPNDSVSFTERALDEFMQEESRVKHMRPKKPRSIQQSIDPSYPLQPSHQQVWQETPVSALPEIPVPVSQTRSRGSVTYRSKRVVLPNFKSQPFGKHQSYNSYQSIRDQFLYDGDEWDKKRALRMRKPRSRKQKKMPVMKELPSITEHKVTAKLALKNFYLLKRKGFAQIAKEIMNE